MRAIRASSQCLQLRAHSFVHLNRLILYTVQLNLLNKNKRAHDFFASIYSVICVHSLSLCLKREQTLRSPVTVVLLLFALLFR